MIQVHKVKAINYGQKEEIKGKAKTKCSEKILAKESCNRVFSFSLSYLTSFSPSKEHLCASFVIYSYIYN